MVRPVLTYSADTSSVIVKIKQQTEVLHVKILRTSEEDEKKQREGRECLVGRQVNNVRLYGNRNKKKQSY